MTITPTTDIEQALTWTYRVQQADLHQGGRTPASLRGGADSVVRLGAALAGAALVEADCHGDAHLLHGLVLGLSAYQRALVIGHAKVGDRPDWLPGARLAMVAEVNRRGSPRRLYDDHRNVIGHAVRSAVELETGVVMLGWDLSVVEAQRDAYRLWRAALADLSKRLGPTRIDGRVVIGPAAPREPWADGA